MMTKIKKYIIALLFGFVALAAIPYLPQDSSFENLSRVKKIDDKFEVDFGENSRVYIGGSESSFKPHVKLGKWDDEVEINVWLETDKKIKPKQNRGKLKWKDEKREIHFYTIDDDKFEFEIILNEKPDSNITKLKIDSRGLKFYHQPALNIEMAGRDCWTDACTETNCCGSRRPIEVVGSYAVYHESKKNHVIGQKNYQAGKAFHIYRPKIIDNAGTEIWGELNITDNLLTVEIPQEFLNNAVYPIRHAAGLTFGYEGAGASTAGVNNDIRGSHDTPASAGEVTKMTITLSASWFLHSVKGILVEDTGKTIIANGVSNGGTPAESAKVAYDVTFGTNPSIIVQKYWLCAISSGPGIEIYYDTGGSDVYDNTNSYASPTDPTDGNYLGTANFTIYATYTTGEPSERRIIKIE